MRNWPVIVVLLAVLLGLLTAGYINKSKGDHHIRKGCFNGDVTLPDFIVLKTCPRTPDAAPNPLADQIHSMRKSAIQGVKDYHDRDDCSTVIFPGGQAFVYGSVEELTLRLQAGFVDYDACGPSVVNFMKNLQGEIVSQKEIRKLLREKRQSND